LIYCEIAVWAQTLLITDPCFSLSHSIVLPPFRELLLNNNFLRVLPYEIGKLFHLVILGLMGNPLQKEFMNIYNEPNGTQKLLTYMLDNLSCESPPCLSKSLSMCVRAPGA